MTALSHTEAANAHRIMAEVAEAKSNHALAKFQRTKQYHYQAEAVVSQWLESARAKV